VEQERAATEQQALEAVQAKLAAEQSALLEAEARKRAEREQAQLMHAREQAERAAREASEAGSAVEKQLLEKAQEQAELQRRVLEATRARVSEAIALAAVEHERAVAEQHALEAVQEQLRVERQRAEADQHALNVVREKICAEEIARAEADRRAAAERESAQLAGRRAALEAEARAAEEARVAAEHKVLEALHTQAETDKVNAEQAQTRHARLQHEQAEAKAIAQQLVERLEQQRKTLGDWHVRAEALLGEAPHGVARRGKRRMLRTLFGGAALCGATAATIFYLGDSQIGDELARRLSLHAASQPAAAVPVTVASPLDGQFSKLQMSYQIRPPLDEVVIQTIAQAPVYKQ
jgi:hypothetical protein